PASSDWRQAEGGNYIITNVRNQASCGSCVAFDTIAAVEGAKNPNLAVDLSDAAVGRNCDNGWWPNQALDAFNVKSSCEPDHNWTMCELICLACSQPGDFPDHLSPT